MDPETIIAIAEAFNDARTQAAPAASATQYRVYNHAAAGLEECLKLLLGSNAAAAVAYAHILAGETIRTAIVGAAPGPKN